MFGVRRQSVRLPLQRIDLRGLQRFLQTQYNKERCVSMQIRKQLRNRHVYETKVSRVPVEKVPQRRYEAGMCGTGSTVCC
jgi:hypothetical protein